MKIKIDKDEKKKEKFTKLNYRRKNDETVHQKIIYKRDEIRMQVYGK